MPKAPSPSRSQASASTAALSEGSSIVSSANVQLANETLGVSLDRCVAAILAAVDLYKKQDAEALAKKECFDGLAKIDFAGIAKAEDLPVCPQGAEQPSIDIQMLGNAFAKAKETLKKLEVGKIKVVGLKGEFFVRSVACGYEHAEAVSYVIGKVLMGVQGYIEAPHSYVSLGTDGMYGGPFWTAPDVTVKSMGLSAGGKSGKAAVGPIFFAEVEHNNRTRIELIRHMGMIFANYPNLNGVLGIKGGRDPNGEQYLVLMVIVVEIVGGTRQRRVTELVDFGPDELPGPQKNNMANALKLPLPQVNTSAVAGTHGAGANHFDLPEWQRCRNGYEDAAQTTPHEVEINLHLLTDGCFNLIGQQLVLLGPTQPAVLNLASIAQFYF